MWRYLVGAGAALLLAGAGIVVFGQRAANAPSFAALVKQPQAARAGQETALPDAAPEASDRTREQKRFDRYDKDRDGIVTRDEYLMQRRKAFAKLDTDRDGRLSFDEWAIRAETKFATADQDKSGKLNTTEFATTAVKRRAHVASRCAPAAPGRDDG